MDITAQSVNTATDEFSELRNRITKADLPPDLKEKLHSQLNRLSKMAQSLGYRMEFDREVNYLDFVSALPFNRSSPDILDLHRTSQILDQNHYGLTAVKNRVLEYLSVLILNRRQNQPLKASVLAFVGLVGSGKTSLAYSIAESLGRKMIRIPFGGLGSIKELRGESYTNPQAEPGFLMKAIQRAGVNNPVVLLDEIDRVALEVRADVMGVLVELLDPEQNFAYTDRYVDYPFDLSKVLFIATANNTGNIATAVLDRLEVIEMPGFSDQEKIIIAQKYLLPKALAQSGLSSKSVNIEEELWPKIIRPLGYDAGIRSLERHVQAIVRKIARKTVEGSLGPFTINEQNVGEYLSYG